MPDGLGDARTAQGEYGLSRIVDDFQEQIAAT